MKMNVNKNEMKRQEYECQFYGYTTGEVINELKDIVTSATEQQTEKLEQTLLKHYKEPEQQNALKKATACFRSKCAEAITEGMPQLESIVHEMFSIPDHVLLPEDYVHQQEYTEEDEKQVDAAIEQLIFRAKKALFLQTCLKEELQDLKKVVSLEAKIKEQQQLSNVRSQVIAEGALKHFDGMVSAVIEMKNKAKELKLLGNEDDLLGDIAQERFDCL